MEAALAGELRCVEGGCGAREWKHSETVAQISFVLHFRRRTVESVADGLGLIVVCHKKNTEVH